MADHSKPTLTSTYSDYTSELDGRLDDLAVGLDPAVTTVTNPPTNAIRWNSASYKWQKWDGSAWGDLSTRYDFTALNTSGNTTLGDATTDTVRVNGYMGLGGAASADIGLDVVSSALTGASQTGVYSELVATSAATTAVRAFVALPRNAAGSYTVTDLIGYVAANPTKGAGSTITNQHGVYIADQTQGTNNYGITSAVSSGSNKWNIYASGTAQNYFAGNVGIGTSSPSEKLHVNSGTGNVPLLLESTDPIVLCTFKDNNTTTTLGVGAQSDALIFYSNTERMRIDSSGNLGLGVTPSAWTGTFKAFQIGAAGSVQTAGDNSLRLSYNSYYDGVGYKRITASAANYFLLNTDSSYSWLQAGSSTAGSSISWTTSMVLDASGNLGIGTSSPSQTLHVQGVAATSGDARSVAIFTDSTAYAAGVGGGVVMRGVFNSSGTITNFGFIKAIKENATDGNYAGALVLGSTPNGGAATERARIDSSGNLGLGVTPSAWSLIKAFQLPSGVYLGSYTGSATPNLYLGANNYFNGSNFIYSGSYAATKYEQTQGAHAWYNAASGTAGNAITFTQAMTLDASGRLGIGVTGPTQKLQISDGTYSNFYVAPGYASGTGTLLGVGGGEYLAFATNGLATERARIDSSGNVGIGTTSPNAKLAVNGSATLANGGYLGWGNADTLIYGDSSSNYMYFRTNGAEKARIDSSGNMMWGTTSAINSGKLSVSFSSAVNNGLVFQDSNAGGGTQLQFRNSGGTIVGSITQNGSNTTYSTSSDYRLKENIQPMVGALTTVAQLKPCTYTWKESGESSQGFIAHELQAVVPDAVTGEKDAVNEDGSIKPQGIDTSFLVATLTAAIQEQQAIIVAQQADLQQLKARLDAANL